MTASRRTTLRSLRSVSSLVARRASSPAARRSALLCGVISLISGLALLGDVLSPALRDRYPVVLMLLTPRTPYLVAVADDVPFAVFLLAAVLRLCVADPFHFALGRTTGPAGIAAASRLAGRTGASRFRLLGHVTQLTRRAPSSASSPLWLVGVTASPTAKSMVATGAAGVRARSVALADVAGTVLRVVVIWHAGHRFPVLARTTAAVVPWVVIPSAVIVVVVGAVRWHRDRVRRRSPVGPEGAAAAVPALATEPAKADGGCHSWTTPQTAVASNAA
jgi:hypothetical protein